MTTIKHPVRTTLLAATLGLIIVIVCSRAHAVYGSAGPADSAMKILVDRAAPRIKPAVTNNFRGQP